MAEEQTDQGGGKKLPIKMLAILGAALLIEAGAIVGAFMFAGGPSEVQADPVAESAAAEAEKPVEVLVIDDKFQNSRTGRAYLYDTELYIVTKRKHESQVKQRLESRRAQIRSSIGTIFRRAEPAHLHEPELSTLTRQITSALNQNLGNAPDGESLINEVLIGKLTEFPPM